MWSSVLIVNPGVCVCVCELFQKPAKMDLLPNLQQRDRSHLLIRECFFNVFRVKRAHMGVQLVV